MIKLGEANISSDYTHYGQVATDHKFVGLFINEAARTFSNVSFVINDNYAFTVKDKPEWFKFEDFRKIKNIGYVSNGNGETRFIINTGPKTITKQGWTAIIYADPDTRRERETCGDIYETKEAAQYHNIGCGYEIAGYAHLEWEEVVND